MDNLIEKGQEDTFVFSLCAVIFILISNICEILDLHLICQYFHHSFTSCVPRFYSHFADVTCTVMVYISLNFLMLWPFLQ